MTHLFNAGTISGPSKGIVNYLCRSANFGIKYTPFKEFSYKLRIPWEEADKEANELVELRKATITKYEKSMK